jgi:hypothetical protein
MQYANATVQHKQHYLWVQVIDLLDGVLYVPTLNRLSYLHPVGDAGQVHSGRSARLGFKQAGSFYVTLSRSRSHACFSTHQRNLPTSVTRKFMMIRFISSLGTLTAFSLLSHASNVKVFFGRAMATKLQ